MRRPSHGGAGAVMVTREQDGETLPLRLGGEALLSLPENPTTGYRWAFACDGVDIAGDAYSAQGGALAGAGGTRTVRVVATRAGKASISATLQRSWEAPSQAVDHCAFHFSVS